MGFELIHYSHVLKALDNIDEIKPDAIIVSAKDFPRHWKVLVQFVRSIFAKENCPIILLTGHIFPEEEKSKASYLGVSCQINESLGDREEFDRLQNVLSRHKQTDERRMFFRLVVAPWHRFGFIFVNPADRVCVPGDLITISTGGISFKPAESCLVNNLSVDMELDECSLRVGSEIYSVICRIVRLGKTISMQFFSLPDEGKEVLNTYLNDISA